MMPESAWARRGQEHNTPSDPCTATPASIYYVFAWSLWHDPTLTKTLEPCYGLTKCAENQFQSNDHTGGSAIDARTTQHSGYALGQRKRRRIEECFGRLKTIAPVAKVRHR